jgi:hypothetical protein
LRTRQADLSLWRGIFYRSLFLFPDALLRLKVPHFIKAVQSDSQKNLPAVLNCFYNFGSFDNEGKLDLELE